jgi:hypothetical protein
MKLTTKSQIEKLLPEPKPIDSCSRNADCPALLLPNRLLCTVLLTGILTS